MTSTIHILSDGDAARTANTKLADAKPAPDSREAIVPDAQSVAEAQADPVFDFDSLVSGITEHNLHGEIDFGPAVGREAM